MSEWSHLPNAKHIDWVIQSIKDNPEEWALAWDAAWKAAWGAAWEATWDTVWDAARDAIWDAARDAILDAAWYASRNAAYDAAWNAVLALIAYDDIEHYFLSSYEELRLIAELSQHPGAILLLPAVNARELIEEKCKRNFYIKKHNKGLIW